MLTEFNFWHMRFAHSCCIMQLWYYNFFLFHHPLIWTLTNHLLHPLQPILSPLYLFLNPLFHHLSPLHSLQFVDFWYDIAFLNYRIFDILNVWNNNLHHLIGFHRNFSSNRISPLSNIYSFSLSHPRLSIRFMVRMSSSRVTHIVLPDPFLGMA